MKNSSPVSSRRHLFRLAGASALTLIAFRSFATTREGDLRGPIDAVRYKTTSSAADRKSVSLQKMIDQAAAENVPVFLPPGTYKVSNLVLPENTRITGVPGASRIVCTGDGHLFSAQNIRRVELSNIVIDGQNRWLGDYAGALLQFTGVDEVLIDNCEIGGSRKHAVQLERCGGRIERSRISGAGQSGIYAVESNGLSITGNEVFDCGNGGILGASLEEGGRQQRRQRQPHLPDQGQCRRHRPERQRHQHLPRRQCHGDEQPHLRLRLHRHPRQFRLQHPDQRQPMPALGRDSRSTSSSSSRAPSSPAT